MPLTRQPSRMAMHVHHESITHAVEALKGPKSNAVGGGDETKDAGASAAAVTETEVQMRGLMKDFEHSAQDLKVAFNYLEEKQTIDSLMQVLPLFLKSFANKYSAAAGDHKDELNPADVEDLRQVFGDFDLDGSGQ